MLFYSNIYNNLIAAVKRRMMDEIQDALAKHPGYSKKVRVTNRFPYKKRLQYGVVLRNSSASQIRMSADNYLANLISHCRLARDQNKPSRGIEWIREDSLNITEFVQDEDVSSQVDSTQRRFFTAYQIVSGLGNTEFANNNGQIYLTINGTKEWAEYVNGEKKIVMLRQVPADADVVKISYHRPKLDPPGIYIIDFDSDTSFIVSPIYIIESEVVIEEADGTETSATLAHDTIDSGSEDLYMLSPHGGNPIDMVKGTDYTIDYSTGVVTLLSPISAGFNLMADYRYQIPNEVRGPFSFRPNQEISDAIAGVVLCVGTRARKYDRQVVIVSQQREPQARIYGGHWDMSLSFTAISKDTIQVEEMVDYLVGYLWGDRKNQLEFEGITLNRVEPTGESEENFIDTTGDLYFENNFDIDLISEWQLFVPYVYEIKRVPVSFNYLENIKMKNYRVKEDLSMLNIESDSQTVIKYPTQGYERVI